jgi:ketosteroid isomerase-like protein
VALPLLCAYVFDRAGKRPRKRLYDRPQAPFSWEPSEVVVLASGNLALSSGPVRDPSGRIVATFTSVWRQEAPGEWRVIFDKGNDVCDCAKPGG